MPPHSSNAFIHVVCRGCIVRRLSSGARACPVCGAATLPPLLPDLGLQRLVYLLVPGLFRSELERRRHFRLVNPQCPPLIPPLGALELTMDDMVSLSLREIYKIKEHNNSSEREEIQDANYDEDKDEHENDGTRYLKCPAGVTVRHLVRLLMLKRGWKEDEKLLRVKRIEMLYRNLVTGKQQHIETLKVLELSWTLLDLACIFKWKRETPMRLFYRVICKEDSENPALMSDCLENNTDCNIEIQRPPTPPPSPKPNKVSITFAITSSSPPYTSASSPLNSSSSSAISTPVFSCTASSTSSSSSSEVTEATILTTSSSPVTTICIAAVSTSAITGVINTVTNTAAAVASASGDISNAVTVTGTTITTSAISSICPCLSTSTSDTDTATATATDTDTDTTTTIIIGSGPNGIVAVGSKTRTQQEYIHNAESLASSIREEPFPKKPRCEVTPVLRTPGPNSSSIKVKSRGTKVDRLEHHKRRKRRNKRVIAEITTTPREDLLKLKVRLTPCPPRITSENSTTTKEKLLQMRAVRREKTKSKNSIEENIVDSGEQEETIEQIINSIPDEVVRVAQTLDEQSQSVDIQRPCVKNEDLNSQRNVETKDEEVLRRLGLVAVAEMTGTSKTYTDSGFSIKCKGTNQSQDYQREALERQLRESKANRVRSLLAEKQMRDALKSIMSKSKEKSTRKGPPPLAPLTLKAFDAKTERPLDLSSGANSSALDLSPGPGVNMHGKMLRFSPAKPEEGKTSDSNLRTLSDAAVSLLGTRTSGKVALRIPQPPRTSNFGIKIKPNLGLRQIPNPQAFVASQYRNQRTSALFGNSQLPS
ncbi:cell wall protein DAN4 isoform X2 [Cephus cinctus]|uniref:Cell wall protein DAN4 isoform X2 n=1 Tax=Cephus cinctus TaxID=211228 RepID=A0AAJ7BNY0_CEPCN|nr:cell wall protein DAN4 isoform X2 [Cephus cinctus]